MYITESRMNPIDSFLFHMIVINAMTLPIFKISMSVAEFKCHWFSYFFVCPSITFITHYHERVEAAEMEKMPFSVLLPIVLSILFYKL